MHLSFARLDARRLSDIVPFPGERNDLASVFYTLASKVIGAVKRSFFPFTVNHRRAIPSSDERAIAGRKRSPLILSAAKDAPEDRPPRVSGEKCQLLELFSFSRRARIVQPYRATARNRIKAYKVAPPMTLTTTANLSSRLTMTVKFAYAIVAACAGFLAH